MAQRGIPLTGKKESDPTALPSRGQRTYGAHFTVGGACEGRFLAYVAVMMESGPVTARARDLEGGGAARLTCEPCAAAHFGALPLPRD